MKFCEFCGAELDYLPFTCKYCGGDYCPKHRLPENHECSFERAQGNQVTLNKKGRLFYKKKQLNGRSIRSTIPSSSRKKIFNLQVISIVLTVVALFCPIGTKFMFMGYGILSYNVWIYGIGSLDSWISGYFINMGIFNLNLPLPIFGIVMILILIIVIISNIMIAYNLRISNIHGRLFRYISLISALIYIISPILFILLFCLTMGFFFETYFIGAEIFISIAAEIPLLINFKNLRNFE